MNVEEKIKANPLLDVAIFSHGFAPYMRDYNVLIEAMWGEKVWGDAKGRYLCRFLHCPEAHLVTTLSGAAWHQAWADTFINYAEWEKNGEPVGFVWGVCYSDACPGLSYVDNSELAAKWSREIEKEMHEAIIETNAFTLWLIFHDFTITKISDEVRILDKVMFPLKA